MSHFDDLAPSFDQEPRRVALAASVAQAIREAVPLRPTWRLLDYGTGTGLVALNLLPQVDEVVAVDTSRAMLDVLREKAAAAGLEHVTTTLCDLTATPWGGPPVDVVVSSMTLHHLADVPLVLRRAVAALQPGGWIAVADLDTESGHFHRPEEPGVHHHGFDRAQIAGWLTAAGCADVTTREACRFTRPCPDGREREYTVFLAAGRRG